MPLPVRPKAVAPPAAPAFSMGRLSAYSGGFDIPEGNYALSYEVAMERPHAGSKGNFTARLGVYINFYPLEGGEAQQKFVSLGTKAHLSWAPNETGTGIVPIPGGGGQSPSNKSNWFIHLESLYNSGMPEGVYDNDSSVLNGIWAHIQSIEEPEERKSFGAKTGEAEAEDVRKGGKIPVVTEILEGGKPWEGTGGVPEEGAAVAAAPAPKAAVKTAAKVTPLKAKVAPVAPPVVEETADATDADAVGAAAVSGITALLEKNLKGLPKLQLRTGVFKVLNESAGPEMATAVLDTYFASDEALNSVLGPMGYVSAGGQVKAQ